MKKRLLSIIMALALCLVLLPATALAATNVLYLDASGNAQTCASATDVSSNTTTWSSGWYVAQGTIEIGSRVTVSGEVHLILADGCILTVTGGIGVNSGNSLTIYGQSGNSGRLTATSTDATGYNAGIGGTGSNAAGSITINGGVITATGSTGNAYGGAGIGGGWQCNGGTITINGGTGNSYGGAGIGGGGYGGSGGTITINGGDIRATGGKSTGYSGHSGAGIGGSGTAVNGGGSGGGGTITISGGKVEATGGAIILSGDETGNNNSGSGAGIGGGSSSSDSGKDRGSGGTITISGGTVTATGGSGNFSGAGIGSGGTSGSHGNSGGTIKISGGTVTATGGESKDVNFSGACGAGIGGGGKGDGGTVTISGGTVTATSGTANRTASTYGGEGIGSGGWSTKVNGSFATTPSGNAIIKASSIGDQSGKAAEAENPWSGFIYEGNDGSVYGNQTLTADMTIESGKTLTVPAGTTLTIQDDGILTNKGNLTNDGTIYVVSTLTNNNTISNNSNIYVDGSLSGTVSGSGNVYYPLTLINCTASQGTSTYSGKTYAAKGAAVKLAANITNANNQIVRWSGTAGTGNGSSCNIGSMPANAVTVTATIENALTITTQPESKTITYGEQTALSVNVSRHSFIESTPLSYQWYKNNVAIPDATGDSYATYTTPTDLPVGRYTYTCKITCGNYNVTSDPATVTVNKATGSVTITGNPGKTYDGQPAALTSGMYNVTGDGTVTVEYTKQDKNSYSTTAPTNAGDYTVRVTKAVGTNYAEASDTKDFTIIPKQVTVSGITAEDKTYDGKTTATLNYENVQFKNKVNGDTLTVSATGTFENKNAGENKNVTITGLTLGGASVDNYILATNGQQTETTASIARKSITPAIEVTGTYTYTGSAITPTFTVKDGETPLAEGDYTAVVSDNIAAGTGKIKVTAKDTGNYSFDEAQQTFTISPAALSASVTLEDWIYGTPNEPVVTSNSGNGGVTYRYKVKDASDYLEAKPTNAGNYTVEATIAATANYEGVVIYDDFTIAPKTLTVTGLTATDRDYDSTRNVTLSGGTLSGIVSGDEGQVMVTTMPTEGTIEDANAGNGKPVTFATITLAGDKAGNYTLTQPIVTVNIEPLGVDVPTVSGTYTYDRTQQTVVLDGFVNTYMSVTGNTGTDAGDYTAVVTLDSNHKWNNGSNGSIEWTIAPKQVTAAVTVTEKAYDGTDTATVSAEVTTGVESGDTITITGLTGTFDDANVGTKTVTINADGKSITGDGSGNYDVTIPPTATGTINKATNTWTTTPAVTNWTYGTPIAPDGEAQFGTVTVEYRLASGTDADYSVAVPTDAGRYTVRFTVAETANYTGLTETKDLTIGKKTIGIDWTNTELTYNGQAQKPTATATGLVGDDTCTITVTGGETNAGSYTATAESLDKDNYQLPANNTTTFSIARREVTVEAGSYKVSKVYDGNTTAGTSSGELSVSGILDADTGVSVVPTPGTYTSPNVGGQDTVAVSLVLSGDTYGNYQLTAATVNVPCTITPRPITINTASATNRDYAAGVTSVEANVTFDNAVGTLTKGSDYTVAGEMTDANAGTGKTVHVTVTLLNGNYSLAVNTTTTTVNIGKIAYTGTTTANGSAMYGNTGRVDLSNYLADGYVIGTITKTNGTIFEGDPSMDGTALTFSFANVPGNVGQTAVITVPVTSTTNYDPYSIAVTVTVEAKAVPVVTAPTAVAALTFNGEAQTLISAGSTTGGEMQYSLTSGSGYSTDLPTATNAGDYTVYYKVVGNSDYADVAENSLTVTIGKREVTATPKDVTITRGSAIPAFELIYTGLLGEDTLTPSADPTFTCFEADGTTAVSTGTAAGTYTITWTNTDIFDGETNYRVVAAPGTLTINNPSYSGGGSNTTTKTETNPDGSTTTTVTDKTTGTVTESTKNTDGSTTVVETKKDGTVTETNKSADGTTGTVVTDKNGTVTEVKSSVSSTAAKEAAKSGEAVTLPVEVPAAKNTEDAPAVDVTVPKSAGSVKVEIPVEKVTPGTVAVIVNADGTEEIVKATTMGENGVVVPLDGSATVKIVDNSKTFDDVAATDWESDAVAFVSAREIFNGTGDATFDPDVDMTRGMMVTVLARYAGANTEGGETWYDKGLEWAKENGVSDGSNPTGKLTREQMAVMLYRYAGSPDIGGQELNFPDAGNVSDFAANAMRWAVESGLINGMDGNLNPQGYATRAQMAAILMRFCQNVAQ